MGEPWRASTSQTLSARGGGGCCGGEGCRCDRVDGQGGCSQDGGGFGPGALIESCSCREATTAETQHFLCTTAETQISCAARTGSYCVRVVSGREGVGRGSMSAHPLALGLAGNAGECRGAPARVRAWRCGGCPPLPHHSTLCVWRPLTYPLPYLGPGESTFFQSAPVPCPHEPWPMQKTG